MVPVCVWHVCVLDAEGSWVGLLVSRALVVAYTAVDQTSYTYSDCLTSFHGLLLPPSRCYHTGFINVQYNHWSTVLVVQTSDNKNSMTIPSCLWTTGSIFSSQTLPFTVQNNLPGEPTTCNPSVPVLARQAFACKVIILVYDVINGIQ